MHNDAHARSGRNTVMGRLDLNERALTLGPRAGELVTRANGDIKDNVGRPVDNGQIGVVDPDTRLIGLHLYDGLLKVGLHIWPHVASVACTRSSAWDTCIRICLSGCGTNDAYCVS